MVIKRGDVYYADLRPVVGSEQGGVRPVLIIQNDIGNRHSPTVICAAITSRMNKAKLPTHIEIEASAYGIVRDSVILLEQLRTIDKRRLKDKNLSSDAGTAGPCERSTENQPGSAYIRGIFWRGSRLTNEKDRAIFYIIWASAVFRGNLFTEK